MWTQMINTEPTVFETTNKDGVKRVRTSKGLYAFLMESSTLEYEMERHCDLIQVGRWLDTKGYGIAMPLSKTNNIVVGSFAHSRVLQMLRTGRR